MNLQEYRDKKSFTNKDLAKLFKVSEATVHNWIVKQVKPMSKHAIRIYRKTKGEVTLQDLGYI